MSTSDFENAKELLKVSGDEADPTADADNENIANGNNASKTSGVQFPPPTQTEPPGPITEEPTESDDKKPPDKKGVVEGCEMWNGDYDFQLSDNFKLRVS